MIKLMTTLVFSIAVACVPLVHASGTDSIVSSGSQVNFRFMEKLDDLYQKLKLNAEQQDQFTVIMNKIRPKIAIRLDILGSNEVKLKGFVFTQDYDASKVKTIAEQQGKLLAELIELNTRLKYQVYQLLDQQQRQQMQEIFGNEEKLD